MADQYFRWLSCGFLPVIALFSAGCGNSNNARLRVMNATPDESSLTFTLGGKAVATNVAYGAASNYVSAGAGSEQVQIEPADTTTALLSLAISVPRGNSTLIAANFSSSLSAIVLADDNTAPSAGNMKLRLLNVSPSLGTADAYVVAPGTDLNTVTPSASSLAFGSASGYLSLAAGTYEVFFTLPGSKFPSIDSLPITIVAGQIRTLAAINSQSGGLSSVELADLN